MSSAFSNRTVIYSPMLCCCNVLMQLCSGLLSQERFLSKQQHYIYQAIHILESYVHEIRVLLNILASGRQTSSHGQCKMLQASCLLLICCGFSSLASSLPCLGLAIGKTYGGEPEDRQLRLGWRESRPSLKMFTRKVSSCSIHLEASHQALDLAPTQRYSNVKHYQEELKGVSWIICGQSANSCSRSFLAPSMLD